MKESGKMIKDMDEGMKDIQMEIFILENFNLERLMEKVNMNGKIHKRYMMGNGLKG